VNRLSAARGGLITLVVATALVACELEAGKASLRFDGDLSGQVDGPDVTCPPPGSVGGDASALWIWTGTVGGRPASVIAAALNGTGVPDALLIRSENTSWAAVGQPSNLPLAPGKFSVSVNEKKVLQIEGIANAMSSNGGRVEIRGAMRCPN
jgi:hypothetical protein